MRAIDIATTDETLEGYGMRNIARCRVARPERVEEVATVLASVAAAGGTIGLRGAGRSYGDAALNSAGLNSDAIVLDCSRLNRILAYDAASGEITVEPGVTIGQLWRYTLADGWWPPVVPGTMTVTIGGALAANIHGKNNWRAGTLGDHVSRFELLTPTGQALTCSRENHPDLFFAAIGGWGLLGCFTSVTLRLHRIYSGRVETRQTAHHSLEALIAALEAQTATATHLVGWLDTTARGAATGRGLLKAMRELLPGEDPDPARSLSAAYQTPSDRIAGVAPVAWLATLGRPLATPTGARLASVGQWTRGNLPGAAQPHLEPYAPANFMLDFIPLFRSIYHSGGLLQHQSFVAAETAPEVFWGLLARARAAGFVSSLAVLKKQRASEFLLNYLCDGYSLALDFSVTRGAERAAVALMRDLNAMTAEAGGRFFLAKDATLTPDHFRQAFPAATLAQFRALKARYDPAETLQTDIYRRVIRSALVDVG